jgi:hypothetical protein
MTRPTLALAALAAFVAPAAAQGVRIETDTGRIRAGAPCRLEIQGIAHAGSCIVARGYGSGVTTIHSGEQTYAIVRDGDSKYSGRLYRTTGGMRSLVGYIYTQPGSYCWQGSSANFCAR